MRELEPRNCPSAIPGLFGTGVDSGGHVLPVGASDPHYRLISAPAPDQPGAAKVVIPNGFPFNGYWLPNSATSQWIAPHANENDFAGGVTEPAGDYVYETKFSLAGLDAATASIIGRVTADNTLVHVLLNGHDVGNASANAEQYRGFTPLAITKGFVAGVNRLDFVVTNLPQTAWPNNAHNPSGFRAELSGSARPLSLVAPNLHYVTMEDRRLSVRAADGVLARVVAPTGDRLTAQLVRGPEHGHLQLRANGSFVYVPNRGFVGTDSFTYRARDGKTESDVSTVTLTVVRPPQLTNPGPQSNSEGDHIFLQVAATDPSGAALTYSATGLPPGLSIDRQSGLISGTLAAGAHAKNGGIYPVTVTVTDGTAAASTSFAWLVDKKEVPPERVKGSGTEAKLRDNTFKFGDGMGTVTVYSDAKFTNDKGDTVGPGIVLNFTSDTSPVTDVHWLQFVYTEARQVGGAKATKVLLSMPRENNTKFVYTNLGKDDRIVDSNFLDPSKPYVDDWNRATNRQEKSLTIFDNPASLTLKSKDLEYSELHGDDFLIAGGKVLYHVAWVKIVDKTKEPAEIRWTVTGNKSSLLPDYAQKDKLFGGYQKEDGKDPPTLSEPLYYTNPVPKDNR